MKIILSNIITIVEPTQEILNYCKKTLVYENPDYATKKRLGLWLGKTPKHISLYDYDGKCVYVPMGCFDDLWKIYPNKELYVDCTSVVKRDFSSKFNLREYQKPCLQALKKYVNGVFVLPCGLGKTEIGLACAGYLKQKTLWIANTKDLVKQAKERCEMRIDCKTSLISEGKIDLSGDIIFSTVQTLVNAVEKGLISQNEFGLIIVDECHLVAVNAETLGMFQTCINYFASRYKLGLTATLHRANGLEVCIPKILGNVIYEIVKDKNDYVGMYENKEILRFPKNNFQVPAKINFIRTNYIPNEDIFDINGVMIFTKLITSLAEDKERNSLLINLAKKLPNSTIILSDRVNQLKFLHENLPNSIEIDGSTNKKNREQAIEKVRNGEIKILLASYQLAKLGLDIPRLENLILATPVKDLTVVVQSIGRVQRPFENKKIANVYDIVDDNVSSLNRFLTKRKSIYKKEGYDINGR